MTAMIYVGIGANLDHPDYGSPRDTCGAALYSLNQDNIHILRCSSWYQSAPMPVSDQPDYINAVVEIRTTLLPNELMSALLKHEIEFGRIRGQKNAARTLDLDLIDFNGEIIQLNQGLTLPHPRLHERAFVLLPLAELNTDWRHPTSNKSISVLINELEPPSTATALEDQKGVYKTAWVPKMAQMASN